jgi:hypothetical protein
MTRFRLNAKVISLTAAALLCMSQASRAAAVTGGSTSVALDSATVTTLTGLGFSIAPIAPATLSGMTAMFPITGGDTTTMIDHSGGLSFTKMGTTADIENFVINLSGMQANTITGELVAGSTMVNGVTLFDIGSGLSLTLDAQLAGDLANAFGIANLTGAAIGTASVNPTSSSPEPSTFGFLLLAALPAFFWLRRRSTAIRERQEVSGL